MDGSTRGERPESPDPGLASHRGGHPCSACPARCRGPARLDIAAHDSALRRLSPPFLRAEAAARDVEPPARLGRKWQSCREASARAAAGPSWVTRRDAVTPALGLGCSCCPSGNEARGHSADLRRGREGLDGRGCVPGWAEDRAGSVSAQKCTPSYRPPGGEQDGAAGGGAMGPAATASDAAGPRGDRPSWVQKPRLLLRRGTLSVRTERGLGQLGRLVTPPRPRAVGCCVTLLERPPGSELRGDQAAEVGGPTQEAAA